jgi:hypothetical protein
LDGLLPLHFECYHNAPLEVLQFLVEQWPEAITVDADGLLALHITYQLMAPLKVIQYLVEQWPEAAKTMTARDLSPCISYAVLMHLSK